MRRYPLAELRRGVTFTYDVAANWKVLAENYNECYHCGPVHPELCELIPAFRRGGGGLEWEAGIPHRDGAWTLTTTGTSARAPFPDLDDAERTRHKGELVYPNLLLSLAAEHVVASTLRPHGPARTTVVCDLLFHPDEIASDRFDPSDAAELWDLVNRQDWAICESVQRGMSSRAWRGRVVRADGGRVGRHLAAGTWPRWAMPDGGGALSPWSGSAGSGRPPPTGWPAAGRRSPGSSSSSSATSAARPTTTPASSAAPTTPAATSS